MDDRTLLKRLVPQVLPVLFLGLIFADFITYQFKIDWPFGFWRRQWQMFSYGSNKLSRLVVSGQLENGSEIAVPMQSWFKYPVAFESSRYDEISRRYESIFQLADYVCRQYNQAAKKGEKLKTVSISSASWEKRSGFRQRLNEVSPNQIRFYPHISHKRCF